MEGITFKPLRDYLELKGISINKMSRELGLAQRIQVFLKHDTGNFSLRVVEKICNKYHLEVDQVMRFTDDMDDYKPPELPKPPPPPPPPTIEDKGDEYTELKLVDLSPTRELLKKIKPQSVAIETIGSPSIYHAIMKNEKISFKTLLSLSKTFGVPVEKLYKIIDTNNHNNDTNDNIKDD